MLRGLDLFSGIGGITLALAPWVRPAAYCESDRFAQSVLLSRMRDGSLPLAPIWDDVRTLSHAAIGQSAIDIMYGGFPCQDISVAGHGKGLAGNRSGLVFEVFRLAEELRPDFIFLENVPAIRARGAERVGKELAALGYDSRWDVLSAYDVGAPHLRERWWLLAANADRIRLRHWGERSEKRQAAPNCLARHDGAQEPVANTHGIGSGQRRRESEIRKRQPDPFGESWWDIEPPVGRVVDGLPHRVDRLRGLGNAVVPAQAREAFRRLMGLAA